MNDEERNALREKAKTIIDSGRNFAIISEEAEEDVEEKGFDTTLIIAGLNLLDTVHAAVSLIDTLKNRCKSQYGPLKGYMLYKLLMRHFHSHLKSTESGEEPMHSVVEVTGEELSEHLDLPIEFSALLKKLKLDLEDDKDKGK